MKEKYFTIKDLFYSISAALVLGASITSIQGRNWLSGFIAFAFVLFLSFLLLRIAHNWSSGGKMLGIIIAIAFLLRFAVGITLYWALPIYGHADADDRFGYVFTDAHTRDTQAWNLATSEHPIADAFSKNYSSDQYGGLLAFNAFIYRYFSPDAKRPLLLILFSAFFAALGIPFLWKAAAQVFGEKVAWASSWISALYPESILLGASAMREPYLLTFSAFALWGFVCLFHQRTISESRQSTRNGWVWLGLGLLGMLFVSPAVALVTIIILAGWIFFANEQRQISWKAVSVITAIFILGLFILSSSLNRSGEFNATSPLHVINDWLKLAVKWDIYQLERGSGWVQKLFDEMPEWMRIPFVALYGILQPVLPAALIHPTKLIWAVINFLRALGWYALLPTLILSFGAAAGQGSRKMRNLLLWLALLAWAWVLLAALRGGGDAWDNPRYRTILFVWQSMLAGCVWVWWRETRNAWFTRVLWCEIAFLLVFSQWYASRYVKVGGQLPFPLMIALILGLWGVILGVGWWQDRKRA